MVRYQLLLAPGLTSPPCFLCAREAFTHIGQCRFWMLCTYLLFLVSMRMLHAGDDPYSVPPCCFYDGLMCRAYRCTGVALFAMAYNLPSSIIVRIGLAVPHLMSPQAASTQLKHKQG